MPAGSLAPPSLIPSFTPTSISAGIRPLNPELSQGWTDGLLSDIQDPLGVYCVLEVCDLDDQNPRYHVFPVLPESLTLAQQYLQTVTPTAGGVFVDDFGAAPSPITLSGTFGRFPNGFRIPGIGARLQGLPDNISDASKQGTPLSSILPNSTLSDSTVNGLTGYKLAKWMSDLVDYAHTPDAKGRPRKAKFYNFAFDRYYEVTLDALQAQMSVQQNTLWIYTLQMTAIRPLQGLREQVDTLSAKLSASVNDTAHKTSDTSSSWLSHLPSWVQTAVTKVSTPASVARTGVTDVLKVMGAVDTGVNRVTRTITRLSPGSVIGYAATGLDNVLRLPTGTTSNIIFFATQLPDYVQAVENVVNHVTTTLPADTQQNIQNAKAQVAAAQAAVGALSVLPPVAPLSLTSQPGASTLPGSTLPYPTVNPAIADFSDLLLTMGDSFNAMDVLLATAGLTLTTAGSPTDSSVVAVATNGVTVGGPITSKGRSYLVRQGDTLSSIAAAVYGDPEQWPMIVEANPLVFSAAGLPTSDHDLSSLMGTTLFLPVPPSFTGNTGADPSVLDVANGVQALGSDLSHTPTTVTRTDGTLDLAVLPPLDTLLEGVWHRLGTVPGTIPDVPNYGSRVPFVVGETFGTLDLAMTKSRVAEALAQEPRLTQVSQVNVSVQNSGVEVAFNASVLNVGSIGNVATTLTVSD